MKSELSRGILQQVKDILHWNKDDNWAQSTIFFLQGNGRLGLRNCDANLDKQSRSSSSKDEDDPIAIRCEEDEPEGFHQTTLRKRAEKQQKFRWKLKNVSNFENAPHKRHGVCDFIWYMIWYKR